MFFVGTPRWSNREELSLHHGVRCEADNASVDLIFAIVEQVGGDNMVLASRMS